MTGQEAANLTRTFHEQIGITGAIPTKLDGDSRGGAALSVRRISGQPIKFVGVGERLRHCNRFILIAWLRGFWGWRCPDAGRESAGGI